EQQQLNSIGSALNLAHAVSDLKIKEPISCMIVSHGLHEITGMEQLQPAKSAQLGIWNSIRQEVPELICTNVDIDLPQADSRTEQIVIRQLLDEFQSDLAHPLVSYRGSRKWVQTFEPMPLESSAELPSPVRESGVYLITGGLSGYGFHLVECLASMGASALVIVDSVPFPQEPEWEAKLQDPSTDRVITEKIAKLQSWKKNGTKILLSAANPADEKQMHELRRRVQAELGTIHGVVHAQDLQCRSPFVSKTTSTAVAALLPKVRAVHVLDELFAAGELDFFIACSPSDAALGGGEEIEHAAAAAYLQAFFRQKFLVDNCFRLAVNWDAWTDGQAENDSPARLPGGNPIKPAEGMEAFRRLLRARVGPQVLVSVCNPEAASQPLLAQHKAQETAEHTYIRQDLDR